MKLADGSPSYAVKGQTQLTIARADMPHMTGVIDIIVVDGPHTLLGRPALNKLWPDLYIKWTSAARHSISALQNFPTVQQVAPAASRQDQVTAAAATAIPDTLVQSPPVRPIPPPPTGEVTQEIGENYCESLCDKNFS